MRSLPAGALPSFVLVLLSLAGAPALAECVVPSPAIVWSYPAEGETVPPDATFWALPNRTSVSSVSVSGLGTAVSVDSWAYEPPTLEPGTDYTLVFRQPDAADETVEHSISFSTASEGPAEREPVAEPVVRGHSVFGAQPELSERCARVLAAGDCYDTGQDSYVRLDVEGPAKLWLVRPEYERGVGRQVLWPAECGAPVYFTNGAPTGEGGALEVRECYEVVAVDEAGQQSPAARYCTATEVFGGDLPGLSCGATSTGSLWVLALVVFGAWRRPRRPRRLVPAV